jgi:hypothetical protein
MRPIGLAELDKALDRFGGDFHTGRAVEYRTPIGPNLVPAGLRLFPECHPGAPFKIVYERPGGYLVLACAVCSTIQARVAVARL